MKKISVMFIFVFFCLFQSMAFSQIVIPPNVTVALQPDYSTLPFVTNEEFNIIPDDGTDQTSNIQAALDSFQGKGGIVWLKPGVYHITQLVWPRSVELRGAGTGSSPHQGTIFIQLDGVNASAIVTDNTLPVTEFMHWSKLNNFQLRKISGSTDTLGSGIEFFSRTGETMRVSHLMIVGFPEDGIRIGEGGTPGYFQHLNVSNNGRYGINVNKHVGSGVRYHGMTFDSISGDNNNDALINLQSVGTLGEMIVLTNIKSETVLANKQQSIIRLQDIFASGISINGVTALAFGSGVGASNTVVEITGQFYGTLRLQSVGYEGMVYAMTRSGTNIPIEELNEGLGFVYPAKVWRVF